MATWHVEFTAGEMQRAKIAVGKHNRARRSGHYFLRGRCAVCGKFQQAI